MSSPRKEMEKPRTFNGKKYKFSSYTFSSSDADFLKSAKQRMGYYVRVVYKKPGNNKQGGYWIYTRKK